MILICLKNLKKKKKKIIKGNKKKIITYELYVIIFLISY